MTHQQAAQLIQILGGPGGKVNDVDILCKARGVDTRVSSSSGDVESGSTRKRSLVSESSSYAATVVDKDPKPAKLSEDKRSAKVTETYLDLVQVMAVLMIPVIVGHLEGPSSPQDQSDESSTGDVGSPVGFVRRCEFFIRWVGDAVWPLVSSRSSNEDTSKLIETIHKIVVAEIPTNVPFDDELVRELLLKYGEISRASDPELLRAMVRAAQSSSGVLDQEALRRALTSDLTGWNSKGDECLSTFFFDIFGVENPSDVVFLGKIGKESDVSDRNHNIQSESEKMDDVTDARSRVRGGDERKVKKQPFKTQVSNIDMVCETNASSVIIVITWTFFLLSVGVFALLVLSTTNFQTKCDVVQMWCIVLNSVYSWTLLAVILSVFGAIMIFPLGVGNNAYRPGTKRQLGAVLVALGFALLPFLTVQAFEDSVDRGTQKSSSPDNIVSSAFWDPLQNLTFATGVSLAGMFLLQPVLPWLSRQAESTEGVLRRITSVALATSNTNAEARLKIASRKKMITLVDNALSLHTTRPENSSLRGPESLSPIGMGGALKNFVLHGERVLPAGGITWTWWKVFNGTLFHAEGIWVNVRLIIFQFAQIIVGAIYSAFLFMSVGILADYAEEERSKLDPTLPRWVLDLYPTRKIVNSSLYPAATTATAVIVLLILSYLPSSVSTILRYRCQLIPSLGSPSFEKLRKTPDTAYMNTGNAVYGMLGAASLFYLVIGLIIFLFQWEFSKRFMMQLLGWGLGLTVTCTLKFMLTLGCRKSQYRAFYRIRPGAASLTSLALECWYIGLGGSVLVGRVTQFLLAALFYVGRIDVPFLAENVALLGYSFDYVPHDFVKDLLVHEAHRHPYVERISQICLWYLKNGIDDDDDDDDDSCSSNRGERDLSREAGACWRQLMVLAVFPWLSKYRVFDAERERQAGIALELQDQLEREEEQCGIMIMVG